MILMHVGNSAREAAVQRAAGIIGERVVAIGPGELEMKLHEIILKNAEAGAQMPELLKPMPFQITPPGSAEVPAMYQMPEVLIFVSLEEDDIRTFLSAFRAEGEKPVALKAAVTPFNLGWSLFVLIGELQREREALRG